MLGSKHAQLRVDLRDASNAPRNLWIVLSSTSNSGNQLLPPVLEVLNFALVVQLPHITFAGRLDLAAKLFKARKFGFVHAASSFSDCSANQHPYLMLRS